MTDYILATATAFWLGLLTSISPCPLATNIAAVSFVGKRLGSPMNVIITGSLYTLGRALTYTFLGVILVSSLLSAPILSHHLQKYMNLALGPILILVGMILTNLITVKTGGFGFADGIRKRIEAMGLWGALLLGILFALSFCPTSAALFFGSLLPLALKFDSGLVLPLAFGTATGIPVMVFALLLALGANQVARAYGQIVIFELWARRVTGVLFILAGIYFCLTHIYRLQI